MVPSRRRALRAVGGLALASVAGCLGAGAGPTDSAAVTTDQTTDAADPTAPAAATESIETGAETPSEATTTREYLTSFPPDERLVLRAYDPVTVDVEMYDSESKEARLAAETYALDGDEEVGVTEFEPRGWVTVAVDDPTTTVGTAAGTTTVFADPEWEGYVGTASRYVLAVAPDGTVEVESYAEK